MLKFSIIAALALSLNIGLLPQTVAAKPSPPLANIEKAVVTNIIDGDTIEVKIGNLTQRVRYIGVDSPEIGQCYYAEAKNANVALVLNQTVTLQRDVNNTDRYRRLLRYVNLPDGRSVNELLVQQGMAMAKAYPPDIAMQSRLNAAQSAAQASKQGMWGACRVVNGRVVGKLPVKTTTIVTPSSTCPQGCATPPPGCTIKGNISQKTGERIYHIPGMQNYAATIISPSYGERWFCTEAEAVANGWRRAQR